MGVDICIKILNGKIYLLCYVRDCCSRAIITPDENVIIKRPHNHVANLDQLAEIRFKSTLVCRAKESCGEEYRYIFAKEAQENPQGAKVCNGFVNARQSMRRSRRVKHPAIPLTLQDFHDQMQNQKFMAKYGRCLAGHSFYHGMTPGEKSIIFKSQRFLNYIRQMPAIKIGIDGTFKTMPTLGGISHMYTVYLIAHKTAFPIIYAFMGGRTSQDYDPVFRVVRNLLRATQITHIMVDYERTIRNSLNAFFPDAHLLGCWFHYKRQIRENASRFKLMDVGNYIMKVQHLPLLPKYFIHDAFNGIMEELVVEYPELIEDIQKFAEYWMRQWSTMQISVHGEPTRTNNYVEEFYTYLKSIVNSSPINFWHFLESLIKVDNNLYLKLRNSESDRERAPTFITVENNLYLKLRKIERDRERAVTSRREDAVHTDAQMKHSDQAQMEPTLNTIPTENYEYVSNWPIKAEELSEDRIGNLKLDIDIGPTIITGSPQPVKIDGNNGVGEGTSSAIFPSLFSDASKIDISSTNQFLQHLEHPNEYVSNSDLLIKAEDLSDDRTGNLKLDIDIGPTIITGTQPPVKIESNNGFEEGTSSAILPSLSSDASKLDISCTDQFLQHLDHRNEYVLNVDWPVKAEYLSDDRTGNLKLNIDIGPTVRTEIQPPVRIESNNGVGKGKSSASLARLSSDISSTDQFLQHLEHPNDMSMPLSSQVVKRKRSLSPSSLTIKEEQRRQRKREERRKKKKKLPETMPMNSGQQSHRIDQIKNMLNQGTPTSYYQNFLEFVLSRSS